MLAGKAEGLRNSAPLQPKQPHSITSQLHETVMLASNLLARIENLSDKICGSGINACGPDSPPPPLVALPQLLHSQLEMAHKKMSEIENLLFGN